MINEKVKALFNNQRQMRRFGPLAKYLPQFYERIVGAFPDYADEIIDRMSDINVHYKQALPNGAVGTQVGLAFRKFHEDRMYRGIRLVNGAEPILVDRDVLLPFDKDDFTDGRFNRELNYSSSADEYRNREIFYHEMLHAISGVSRHNHDSQAGDVMIFGNASQWEVAPVGKQEYYKPKDASLMLEEGIVEDWATDIALNEIDNEYTRSLDYAHIMVYPMASNFVSMWNLASNNQLRKEFVSGVSDGSKMSEITQEFKSKFVELYNSFEWNNKGQKQLPENCNVDKISQAYVDLINYCQAQFYSTPHPDSAVSKFKSDINYLMSCKPLLNEISKVTSQENSENYDKMEQLLCTKVFEQFGISQNNSQANYKLIMQEYDVNSRLAGGLKNVNTSRPAFRTNNGYAQSSEHTLERDKT